LAKTRIATWVSRIRMAVGDAWVVDSDHAIIDWAESLPTCWTQSTVWRSRHFDNGRLTWVDIFVCWSVLLRRITCLRCYVSMIDFTKCWNFITWSWKFVVSVYCNTKKA
jgi:hypothetical protein